MELLDIFRAVPWFFIATALVLGLLVGSFLNVVIYRLPAGLSVVHPGSFCPRCRHPIRWYHNLPVVGWLLLRGKCYDCQKGISARYPIVELVVAALFGGLAWIEVFSYPTNMALGPPPLEVHDWTTAGVQCGYHLILLCGLLCAGFMEFDGNRLPRQMALAILATGIIVPLFFAEIHPVHFLHRPGHGNLMSDMGLQIFRVLEFHSIRMLRIRQHVLTVLFRNASCHRRLLV